MPTGTCEHPVVSSANRICGKPAKFRIVLQGKAVTLNLYGAKVSMVCGRHGNSVAVHRPGARMEAI